MTKGDIWRGDGALDADRDPDYTRRGSLGTNAALKPAVPMPDAVLNAFLTFNLHHYFVFLFLFPSQLSLSCKNPCALYLSVGLWTLFSFSISAAVLQQWEVRGWKVWWISEDLWVILFENYIHTGHAQLWPECHLQHRPHRHHVAGQQRNHNRWGSWVQYIYSQVSNVKDTIPKVLDTRMPRVWFEHFLFVLTLPFYIEV